MWSKNKHRMTTAERKHVDTIKSMSCAVCSEPGPSDAHEIKQGDWWTSIPLCKSCHTGDNGWHGTKALWRIRKMDELDALSNTIKALLS